MMAERMYGHLFALTYVFWKIINQPYLEWEGPTNILNVTLTKLQGNQQCINMQSNSDVSPIFDAFSVC